MLNTEQDRVAMDEKVSYKEQFCKDEYGIKENYFVYEGTVWRVVYESTYWLNKNNEGTPFVIGINLGNLCEHIRLKVFLVKKWVKSEITLEKEKQLLSTLINKKL